MTRLRKPGSPERTQVSVKLATEDVAFLKDLGFRAAPTALRAMVEELRSYSRLPAPVVAKLKRDALRLKLNPLEYVRLCLHQRYRQLARVDRDNQKGGRFL
jgi:hypothetical protein